MAVKDALFALLDEQRGESVSGEQLAARLGVSRAAVWKAIEALREDGLRIDAATNRGYALAPDADALTARSILKHCTGAARELRVETHRVLPSTLDAARARAQAGEAEGLVVAAEEQTAGRGRLGRSFYSPRGTGLYLSLLLRPALAAQDAPLLTTAAAVAAAEAVEALSGRAAGIKWVNDVYQDGRKVCGILTEAAVSCERGGLDYAVLGVGINVRAPEAGFPDDLAGIAGGILAQGGADARARLAAEFLSHFLPLYAALPRKSFLAAYRRRLLYVGEPVSVLRGSASRPATALGVDDDFRLLVRYEDGAREALSGGEISLRPRGSE